MQRLTIWRQGPDKVGLTLPTIRISASTTHVIAAGVCAFWGFVLIGFAFWLSNHGSAGMGAALACLACSIGYFWFARTVYRDRSDDRARWGDVDRDN